MSSHTRFLSLCLLAIGLGGCSILGLRGGGADAPGEIAESDRGVRAVQRYEDAKNTLAQASSGSLPEGTAREGMQAAMDCRTLTEHLVSLDHYAETDELTTSDGALALVAMRERCQQMYDRLHASDLEEPPAVGASDPELEARVLELIRRNASLRGWDEDFRAVRITSRDWSVDRHPVSGLVLSRSRQVAGGAVWPDGHCTFQQMTVSEPHDGGRYSGELALDGVGSQVWVSCEHVGGDAD